MIRRPALPAAMFGAALNPWAAVAPSLMILLLTVPANLLADRIRPPGRRMTALISVRELGIRSDRGGEILRGASLELEPGRVLALVGESGAGPRVLICDGITSALDPVVQRRIVELLRELQHSTGIAIIFISHDLPPRRPDRNRPLRPARRRPPLSRVLARRRADAIPNQ